jgi:hypothetical protein
MQKYAVNDHYLDPETGVLKNKLGVQAQAMPGFHGSCSLLSIRRNTVYVYCIRSTRIIMLR